MKDPTLHELKKELINLPPSALLELCLRLAKHKTENKQLLNYLVFEREDEQKFLEKIKKQMDLQFEELNKINLYLAKKGLRKILRIVNRNLKFSGAKTSEIEMLIYYCTKIRNSDIPVQNSKMLTNLYQQQINRIYKAQAFLHEDIQSDYYQELKQLELFNN